MHVFVLVMQRIHTICMNSRYIYKRCKCKNSVAFFVTANQCTNTPSTHPASDNAHPNLCAKLWQHI